MALSQPSTALHQAVSDWLRRWSDFALAQPAPAADLVAPDDQRPLLDAPVSEPAAAPLAHWLATVETPTPPAHWLALLHTHGLTWDAAQGITTPEESTVEQSFATAETHHLATDQHAVEPAQPDAPAICREGRAHQAPATGRAWREGLPLPSRQMPSAPRAVAGNVVDQSQAKPLVVEQRALVQTEAAIPAVQPILETYQQPQAVSATIVEPLPAPDADATLPNPSSNPNPPVVEWLTRLHQGVTALLAATSAAGNLADLPALLHTYAPIAPTPTATSAPTPAAIDQPATPTHVPPTAITDHEWALPPMALPVTGEERPTPLVSAPPPVMPTPQRVTRLHLRPPAEARSQDFSLSPKPQATGTPSSGKERADNPVEQTALPGRVPERPAADWVTKQSDVSLVERTVQKRAPTPAAPARQQPAVHIARLRVQTPGGEQAETVATVAPAMALATAPPLPVPVAAPMPTLLPASLLPTAPLAPVEEPSLVTSPDDQATRLARIEALLTRLLAEQGATSNTTVPPAPAPVSASVPLAYSRWPALPERAVRTERPPQRRSAEPARRRRLEEEQRGRSWNG